MDAAAAQASWVLVDQEASATTALVGRRASRQSLASELCGVCEPCV
jgi:hypothetical protein